MANRFFSEVDFDQIPTKNFVAEGSATPPDAPVTGQLWNDTSIQDNAVLKYYDGDEWVRMDGGGDIPNGMILDRHIAANAAITWSKIAHPTNLATTDDVSQSATTLSNSVDTRIDTETTRATGAETALGVRIDGLGSSLTGSYVTLGTTQTVTGNKTFTGTTVVPVGANPTEAVRLSQLTAEASARTSADTALDGRLSTVETAVLDVNNATQSELDSLTTRVTAAEGVNATQTTNIGTVTTGLASEVTARTGADTSIRTDFTAADDGLSDRIDDEAAARAAADTTNASAISTETSRATTAEGALGTRITNETTDRTTGDTTNATAITAEVDRAESAEEDLAADIATEASRATGAEDAIASDLDAEVTRATGAEGTLTSNLASEVTRATGAETALGGRITTLEGVDNLTQAEFNTFNSANTTALAGKADLVAGKVPLSQLPSVRTDDVYVVDFVGGGFTDETDALASVTGADEGDVAVINGGPGGAFINTGAGWVPLSSGASGATDAEVTAAVAAEAALREAADSALGDRVTTLEGVDYETQAEANTEHTARLAAETALGGRIDTEATARATGDTTNATAITTEATARAAADTTLTTNLASEVSRATAAESTNATNISNEATTRGTADDALGVRIDNETAARISGDADNADALDDEVTRATGAEGTLSGRITTEVTDRTDADTSIRTDFAAADSTISSAVSAEVTRATGAEGTLTTNLASEATTRGSADTALGVRIDGVVSSVTSEASTARAAEGGLNTRVTALENATTDSDLSDLADRVTATEDKNTEQDGRLSTAETALGTVNSRISTAVATETDRATAAEGTLTTAISDEATARGTAVTAVDGRVTTEISNRTTADNALGLRIDSAESTITSSVGAEATSRANADTSIRTDFAAADATLQTDINTRAVDANVVHKTGAETVAGVKTFSSSPVVPTASTGGQAVNLDQLQSYVTSEAFDPTALEAADTALDGRLDTLEGTGAGSVQARADARIAAAAGVSIAPLVDDKIPLTFLPALALTNVSVYADLAARDAATGQDEGDVAIVTDIGGGVRGTYIFDGTNWVAVSSPADVTESELAASVAAGLAALTAGAGLTKTGNTFNVVGTAGRITANADSVDIATDYVGQASITTVGTITSGTWNGTTIALANGGTGYAATDVDDLVGHLDIKGSSLGLFAKTLTDLVAGTPLTVTHNLGGTDVVPSLRIAGTGEVVFADIKVTGDNTVSVTVDPSYDESVDLRLTVVGGPVGEDGHITSVSLGR